MTYLTPVSAPPGASPPSRTWIDSLPPTDGANVTVAGWLHHLRPLKRVAFLLLRDATGLLQVVVEDERDREHLATLPHETVLAITGTIRLAPNAPGGRELHAPAITVLAQPAAEPAIDLYRPDLAAQLPTLLDHAAVTLRHPRRAATWRLAAGALAGFRSGLTTLRFTEITTPKILGSAPEGGANVFPIDYFGQTAYLAQSPQLYKQMMVGVYERVFETAPAFRAEPHATSRHLAQFFSLDAEIGFITDHFDVMTLVTDVLRHMVNGMIATGSLDLLEIPSPTVPERIPHLHFADALTMVSDALGQDLRDEPDLAPEHERWLGDWALRTHGSDFLFVTGYPMRKRPFYTHPQPSDPRWSNSFDLLYRGLEIVTGGQRLHRYADYLAALNERGIDPAPFTGYLEAFRHGMPPHGGFALGLERLVMQLCGIANVRTIALFPRDLTRLTP